MTNEYIDSDPSKDSINANRKRWGLLAVAGCGLFALSVLLLSQLGKEQLKETVVADTTISYIDLARQAGLKRDYRQAERMFQKAIATAEQSNEKSVVLAHALATYGEFLRKMKRKDEAIAVEEKALELQGIKESSAPATN